eukprot:557304-Pleurochrysis_carterae.AAC.4
MRVLSATRAESQAWLSRHRQQTLEERDVASAEAKARADAQAGAASAVCLSFTLKRKGSSAEKGSHSVPMKVPMAEIESSGRMSSTTCTGGD